MRDFNEAARLATARALGNVGQMNLRTIMFSIVRGQRANCLVVRRSVLFLLCGHPQRPTAQAVSAL